MNNEEIIRHCLTKQVVLINNMERNHAALFNEIIKIIDYMSPDECTGKFRKSIKRRDVMVKICNDLMQKVRQGLTVFEEDVKEIDNNHYQLNYCINKIDAPTEANMK